MKTVVYLDGEKITFAPYANTRERLMQDPEFRRLHEAGLPAFKRECARIDARIAKEYAREQKQIPQTSPLVI
jgi:hypothetical protein